MSSNKVELTTMEGLAEEAEEVNRMDLNLDVCCETEGFLINDGRLNTTTIASTVGVNLAEEVKQ
jgi:hypothetical protein